MQPKHPNNGPRRSRFAMTIREMMGLVVYAAVASACVAPAYRLWELGIIGAPFLIQLELPAIALGWAATTMILVRRGRRRDQAVASLVLFAVAVGLVCTSRAILPLAIAASRGWPSALRVAPALAVLTAAFGAPLLGLVALLVHVLVRESGHDARPTGDEQDGGRT